MSNRAKRICRTFVIIIASCVLIAISLLFFSISMDAIALNNSFINDRFSDWKSVLLDEEIQIKIPQEWDLVADGDKLIICDCEGHVLALGKRRTNTPNAEELLQEMYHSEIDSHIFESETFGMWNFANCFRWNVVLSNGEMKESVMVELWNGNYEYGYEFVFFQPEEADANSVYKKAEAMAWSMTYVGDEPGFLEQKALHLR